MTTMISENVTMGNRKISGKIEGAAKGKGIFVSSFVLFL